MTLLAVEDLGVAYGPATALSGVSLSVRPRQSIAVLGANGAGKSSFAQAICGLVKPAAGSVRFGGTDVTGWTAEAVARLGMVYLPEGRGIFPGLTVRDNLAVFFRRLDRTAAAAAVDRVFGTFPRLGERSRQVAGTLSGGEQQMLALSRALGLAPRLVVADEPSLGLAPALIDDVFEALEQAKNDGVAVILIEQYAHRALAFADDAVILRQGRLVWSGPAADADAGVLEHYHGQAR